MSLSRIPSREMIDRTLLKRAPREKKKGKKYETIFLSGVTPVTPIIDIEYLSYIKLSYQVLKIPIVNK